MALSEIKLLLQERKRIPLTDLAHHFNKDPEVMRSMLGHWEQKGKVRKLVATAPCQSECSSCGSGPLEIYEWVE